MPGTSLTILTPSDAQVDRMFKLITGDQAYSLRMLGSSNTVSSSSDVAKAVISENVSMIAMASYGVQGITVAFHRNMLPAPEHLAQNNYYFNKPDAVFSSVGLIIDSNSPISDDVLFKLHTIIQHFLIAETLLPKVVKFDGESPFSPRETALLSAIQGAAADQVVRIDRVLVDLTDRFDEREKILNERLQARQAALEEDVQKERDALAVKTEEIAAKQRELDDRDNTHARRAIRGELIQGLRTRQTSFEIAQHTRALRTPIHIVFITLLGFTLVGAVWSLYVWGTSPADTWGPGTLTSALKTVGFSFGFLTSAGLYISWMNRWFDRNTDAQFQTKQLEIDFNRASWAVEAALEWKGSQGEQMPEALLAGVTKHLFDTRTGESAEYSPLEALASNLLGAASNLKMNMGGSEMSFDRKSMKELKGSDPKG